MALKSIFILWAGAVSLLCSQEQLTDDVDPFIGTGGHGHTYPGATVPFGMVQVSPDNGHGGWDWCSGYNYSDTVIAGFSHTHLSGTGIGDRCDILFMPSTIENPEGPYSSRFSHAHERARPGYYAVDLLSTGIRVELTATTRAAFHRYTFPASQNAKINIDLGFHINWDTPVTSQITIVNDSLITGYRFSKGWAPNQKVFFAARFSKPFESVLLGADSTLQQGERSFISRGVKCVLQYRSTEKEEILVKVGISAVDVDGALNNLDKEIPDWNFDAVRRAAADEWERQLQKIRVTSNDRALKETFYTALYHTMLAPVVYSDIDGRYRGGDDSIHQRKGFTNYTVFSLWDTFRAEHPLSTILHPDRVNDFINSLLRFSDEFGSLPVWTLDANETFCMIGYHSIPVITDAFYKGFNGFDPRHALDAMVQSGMGSSSGLRWYREKGYVPADSVVESVSKTVEYSYDDWCIARMAKSLGQDSVAEAFFHRAQYYKNVFDPSTGLMRGKLFNGKWRSPFDPLSVDHRANDYTEGNAWQYSWFVPQDIAGLIEEMGGRDAFVQKLDSLFDQHTALTGNNISPDISGMIGQYAQGNEPSHHIAYLYDYAGMPWKTEERVNSIIRTLYNNTPAGLCGNEDCGQMSAWYVFSAMGFYPVNPADQTYEIGSPQFDSVSIDVGGGKYFVITAINRTPGNKYIASASLNGRPLTMPYIRHTDLMNGGSLIFRMTDAPTMWGTHKGAEPPSMSTDPPLHE